MDAPPPANTGASSGARGLFGLPLWVHAWAWGGILAVVLLLLGATHAYDGRNVWRDWTEAKALRRPVYAEQIYPDDLLRTRANSWSNLTERGLGIVHSGVVSLVFPCASDTAVMFTSSAWQAVGALGLKLPWFSGKRVCAYVGQDRADIGHRPMVRSGNS
jgi:hypothetical protein